MKAKCRICKDIIEVNQPKTYKVCKCGAIGLEDGGDYKHVHGYPEDFEWRDTLI